MSDKLKTVREELAEQLAFMEEVAAPMSDKSWGYEEGVLLTGNEAKLILAALSSMEAEAGEAVAWMRKWAYDNDNGSVGCRPHGWKLNAITQTKLLPTDVPLYAHPKAQEEEVELTEADVERMAVADNVDPEQWSYLETIGQQGTYLDGMALGIRHLASKYRLMPR